MFSYMRACLHNHNSLNELFYFLNKNSLLCLRVSTIVLDSLGIISLLKLCGFMVKIIKQIGG